MTRPCRQGCGREARDRGLCAACAVKARRLGKIEEVGLPVSVIRVEDLLRALDLEGGMLDTQELMDYLGISRGAVMYHLRTARARGWVEKRGRLHLGYGPGQPNQWWLTPLGRAAATSKPPCPGRLKKG